MSELVVIDDSHSDHLERVGCPRLEALIEEGDRLTVPEVVLRELSVNGNLAIKKEAAPGSP